MTEGLAHHHDGWRFSTLIDDAGDPPCDPPDDCPVCVLFTGRRPGETRGDWLARITGISPKTLEAAS